MNDRKQQYPKSRANPSQQGWGLQRHMTLPSQPQCHRQFLEQVCFRIDSSRVGLSLTSRAVLTYDSPRREPQKHNDVVVLCWLLHRLACGTTDPERRFLKAVRAREDDESYKRRTLEDDVEHAQRPARLQCQRYGPIKPELAFKLAETGCDHQRFLPHNVRMDQAARWSVDNLHAAGDLPASLFGRPTGCGLTPGT
jgi:hypothetical protein